MNRQNEMRHSNARTRIRRGGALASVGALAMALTGCVGATTAPVTPGQAPTMSSAERQQGAQAHPQLLAEFGGAYSGPQANYVERVGKRIAMQSGLANASDAYTVTLLNSNVNNAFAIPGGYIYTTRQLVALMDNEAELAGVLGHEVGHVAARHSQQRQQAAQQNSILGAVGAILSGVLLGDSALGQAGQKLAMQGSQLLTLKYSRSQESQADDLGIAYLSGAGYDPIAMSTVLQSLAQQNALDAQMMGSSNQVPEWASTHPDPASRVSAARQDAQGMPGTTLNRDAFLTAIDGMMYGDDPQQGIVDGGSFIHPVMRFAFQAPNGYFLVNGTQAVSISGQSGKGQLTSRAYSGNLDSYVSAAFADVTGDSQQQIQPSSVSKTTVNGLPAAYGTARVNSGNGQVDVTVFAYELSSSQAVHFVTITQAGNAGIFNSMYSSMRRISASEASAVKARKIDVITVRSGDTLQGIANRMAYDDYKLERFLVLNSLTTNSTLQAGQKVKIVTY
ncbi:M48 family metalloprotease [Croceicoccus mobilis]|uniref:Metalloprotease n=1 Tax=Croceicoccus mobilis TaxID=1703339 RepID=A0A916Z5Y6_9SPHN|nr:M48 family metalloprotease [Croceicoccus mobilis]GGD78050.1 metalloprotease [Croceicoccus mobilis]